MLRMVGWWWVVSRYIFFHGVSGSGFVESGEDNAANGGMEMEMDGWIQFLVVSGSQHSTAAVIVVEL